MLGVPPFACCEEHADPFGWQLHCLVKSVQAFEDEISKERWRMWKFCDDVVEYWVFVDFISLPQYRRKFVQSEFFQRAMGSMHIMYAHAYVTRVFRIEQLTPEKWKQSHPRLINICCEQTGKVEPWPFNDLKENSTPYFERGWCVAEMQWMSTQGHVIGFAPMPPDAPLACLIIRI